MLRRAAGEVEHQPLAGDGGAQAQLEVALARLEHVLAPVHAVGERGQAARVRRSP